MKYKYHMLIDSFPNLSESFIVRHAAALPCSIVTGKHRSNLPIDFSGEVIELGHPLRGFKSSKARRGLSRIVPRLRSSRLSKPIANRLRAHWTANRPDAVLAEFGPNGIRAAQVCPELEIPFVIHFHGYDASALPRFVTYREEIRRAFALCHSVIVVSAAMKNTIRNLGCPLEKIHLIPCGVPIEDFETGQCTARQPCRFIAVGRMVPKKAPIATLKAFALCQKQAAQDVCLTFVGDGPLLGKAEKFVRENRLTNVQLLGARPHEDVKEHLSNAGCFIQHSVTSPDGNTEGWPVAIAEAMAMGLPVVSTNHAGIMDQIEHGVTGFRVDEHDFRTMGNLMALLANAPERRQAMGMAARVRIEQIGGVRQTLERLRRVLHTAALQ